jgi:hypothetical protein
MIKLIFTVAAALLSTSAFCQTKSTTPTFNKGFVSAGINPTYPFFGGYGAKVFYNFPKRWSVGKKHNSALGLCSRLRSSLQI